MSNVEARIQDILNHTSPQVRPQYLLSDIKEAVEVIERLRCILDEAEAKHNLLNAVIKDLAAHVWRGDWDKLKPETRAALGEKA